ncbi:MAG: hypothetical protein U1D97_06675 [Desulfuromonadales bacterium]|nr:hypothetical protein [Desulfuromonadales bacterium]
MATLYRNKETLTPHRLSLPMEKDGVVLTAPQGYVLTTEEGLFFGEYRDISPEPPVGFQLGTEPTWNEEDATVTLNVIAVLAQTPEETALKINATIDAICESVNLWVNGEINAAGLMMVDRILRLEPANAKALATDNWVRAEYYEAEVRKYYVMMGAWSANFSPDDFSLRTKKPFLVSALDVEYRRLYPPPVYVP